MLIKIIIAFLQSSSSFAQNLKNDSTQQNKSEIFSNGFIDVMNNGQVNASARIGILPEIETNGLYHGYSTGFGVQINKLVDIKAIYYKYNKAPEIDYGLPIYQFTFNYTMNK